MNGKFNETLPAVVIYTGENGEMGYGGNMPAEMARDLDYRYPEGYILFCSYLQQFNYSGYDRATPHKKAVVGLSNLSEFHDLDIARERNLFYCVCNNLGKVGMGKYSENKPIQTGDRVHIYSDGVDASIYLVEKNQGMPEEFDY